LPIEPHYGTREVCAEPGEPTFMDLRLTRPLDPSVRTLTVRIVPDPQLALSRSVSATEVYGGPIERTISVPGP